MKEIDGPFACCGMIAHIGDIIKPTFYLALDIFQINKVPQRPEVLAEILDGAFYLPFFMGSTDGAGVRPDAERSEKFKERFVETDDRTNPFGNGGKHIVDDDFAGGPIEIAECLQ